MLFYCIVAHSGSVPVFSTAGFYELPNSGREVYNMNLGWRFHKGDAAGASGLVFDDSAWESVSLPNGIELLPEEASGSINYQGVVWYRKHFSPGKQMAGKKVFIHFEGIMGKSQIWLNGQLITTHYGGYLPVIADITDHIHIGSDNVLAVCADNSNDDTYAPGKLQYAMDFTYFGGIYRDCWLVTHDSLYITDPNYEDEKGGGGLFVTYPELGDKKAEISLQLHLRNARKKAVRGEVFFRLTDISGKAMAECREKYSLKSMKSGYVSGNMTVYNPQLWSPESPVLYWLEVGVLDSGGRMVDGYRQRIGIRTIEMKGGSGLWLNGRPYEKLIGGNRHQDFAVIGNALPNSLHWRDAFKLRNAGMRVIRATQYPHDPAFLDACDELGLFVIDAVAGWQFYNDAPVFSQRVYDDIRNLVRRDRNHPSLLFFEPILNETYYPESFASQAKLCVDEEMKFRHAYSATDLYKNGAKSLQYGAEYYPVIYAHPSQSEEIAMDKVYFTREWGDNVDDWRANNSTSRVCRAWGEVPMLVQAEHYACPKYPMTCIESFYNTPSAHMGGTMWHAFDHQRGCNPITFYGGIMDAYRQPKTAYYMFMSQRPDTVNPKLPVETGPMVYVANEMTPFSPSDVTVYSNCEEVRLTIFSNGKQLTWKRSDSPLKMPSPVITFKNAFDFMATKYLSRAGRQKEVFLLAEGLIDGKVVATHKRIPSRRSVQIRIRKDDDGVPLVADGSDVVVVVAEIIDSDGTVKRLNNNIVHFSIEGEGEILGGAELGINPVRANWGSAPILVRSTAKPGKIKVRARICGEGVNAIKAGELEFETVAPSQKYIYDEDELGKRAARKEPAEKERTAGDKMDERQERKIIKELEQTEKQQESFGE